MSPDRCLHDLHFGCTSLPFISLFMLFFVSRLCGALSYLFPFAKPLSFTLFLFYCLSLSPVLYSHTLSHNFSSSGYIILPATEKSTNGDWRFVVEYPHVIEFRSKLGKDKPLNWSILQQEIDSVRQLAEADPQEHILITLVIIAASFDTHITHAMQGRSDLFIRADSRIECDGNKAQKDEETVGAEQQDEEGQEEEEKKEQKQGEEEEGMRNASAVVTTPACVELLILGDQQRWHSFISEKEENNLLNYQPPAFPKNDWYCGKLDYCAVCAQKMPPPRTPAGYCCTRCRMPLCHKCGYAHDHEEDR